MTSEDEAAALAAVRESVQFALDAWRKFTTSMR